MFERFTDRARVVVLGQEEARLLNHNYVGTEHMLLGLIHEGQGVAAKVLVKLGADLSRVRQQVIRLLSGYAVGGEEAVARARLVRMTVPEDLREAEEQLAQVRREKEAAIDAEEFERAAGLRDRNGSCLRGWPSRSRHGRPGWTLRRSSRRTIDSTARPSACGSCCTGTGSSPTAGLRRPPERAMNPGGPDRQEPSLVRRAYRTASRPGRGRGRGDLNPWLPLCE